MNFDIVIVGGGLVGASLACALQDQNFKIAIIDQDAPLVRNGQKLEARALALSYTSLQCLKTMGVWNELSSDASPILTVHASKKGHFGQTRITAAAQNLPELGSVVSADDLDLALYQCIEKSKSNIYNQTQIFRPDKIVTLEHTEDEVGKSWVITLESGRILKAKLLVGADGAGSFVRKFQGIGINTHDYQQMAIVANVNLEHSHQGVAYERFLENGAIAMLPFGENSVKSVWIASLVESEQLLALSETEYLKRLQEQFGFRLGRLVNIGKRVQFPLRLACSESIYGNGFVLIGNAANTLTPIAAQGFNLGLRDVATLAEKIVEAKKHGLDIGSIDVLGSYAGLRQPDHHSIRQLTDKLADSHLLQWLGILASEWISPFRNKLVERGLGRQQVLPSLCRGVKL